MGHCEDLARDRRIGQYWERQFCLMAARRGLMFTPMQIGRKGSIVAFTLDSTGWNQFTLPDVTIWTAPGQHHEIKHKNPTRRGTFGLEQYRFNALMAFAQETEQQVLYTIHNHDLSGGRDVKTNQIAHWITADVAALDENWSYLWDGPSWVNGEKKIVSQYFWPIGMWRSLIDYWVTE